MIFDVAEGAEARWNAEDLLCDPSRSLRTPMFAKR